MTEAEIRGRNHTAEERQAEKSARQIIQEQGAGQTAVRKRSLPYQ